MSTSILNIQRDSEWSQSDLLGCNCPAEAGCKLTTPCDCPVILNTIRYTAGDEVGSAFCLPGIDAGANEGRYAVESVGGG